MKQTDAGLWIPTHLKPAVKRIAIVFWVINKTQRIVVGCPEAWPAPRGMTKVVCRTTREVEKWSQKMRDQDRRDEEMSAAERDLVEGAMREYARADLNHRMATSTNQMNRDFCHFALQKMDEEDARRKMEKRESWMHCESHEDGH